MIFLCTREDLAATGAKDLVLEDEGERLEVLVVRLKDSALRGYINACPHQFIPLNIFPGHVFTENRKHLVCSGHGALFEPGTGLCVQGPCEDEFLEPLEIAEEDGRIYLSEARSPAEIAREKRVRRNW